MEKRVEIIMSYGRMKIKIEVHSSMYFELYFFRWKSFCLADQR